MYGLLLKVVGVRITEWLRVFFRETVEFCIEQDIDLWIMLLMQSV